MTQNIQVSKKFNDGTIVVIAGDNFEEFMTNVAALVGDEESYDILAAFKGLVPASAGAMNQAVANVQQTFPQAQQVADQPRQGAGTPPGNVTTCPSHGQPGVYHEGGISKAGNAYPAFFTCPVTGEGITWNGKLKTACPDSKR